ncbi:hypothetical protein GCM10027075_74170 [Streptomyces heilongjiangensis]
MRRECVPGVATGRTLPVAVLDPATAVELCPGASALAAEWRTGDFRAPFGWAVRPVLSIILLDGNQVVTMNPLSRYAR